MELSLNDVFYSMSVIETDAAKIWSALVVNYPSGHFDGIMEDMYGGNMTVEQERRINRELEIALKECQRLV